MVFVQVYAHGILFVAGKAMARTDDRMGAY